MIVKSFFEMCALRSIYRKQQVSKIPFFLKFLFKMNPVLFRIVLRHDVNTLRPPHIVPPPLPFPTPPPQKSLPMESKTFTAVDRHFKDIMRKTRDRPNALQAGTTPGWLETLQRCNESLERVQKQLEDYLESKRIAFPRFYFLSNDELLEILSQVCRT